VPAETDPVVVTMTWEQVDDALLAHLARYVVISRGDPGCRNIDLCASVTVPGRVVVIGKWESGAAQRAHFDGAAMVALAAAARDLGAARPDVDLLEGISAHDLA
jgi:quinol monooxygenase YgiN